MNEAPSSESKISTSSFRIPEIWFFEMIQFLPGSMADEWMGIQTFSNNVRSDLQVATPGTHSLTEADTTDLNGSCNNTTNFSS